CLPAATPGPAPPPPPGRGRAPRPRPAGPAGPGGLAGAGARDRAGPGRYPRVRRGDPFPLALRARRRPVLLRRDGRAAALARLVRHLHDLPAGLPRPDGATPTYSCSHW